MSLNIIAMVQSSNDGDSNITRTSECVASVEVDEGDNISAAAFYTLPDVSMLVYLCDSKIQP